METKFNTLYQANSVQVLLDAAIAAYQVLSDGTSEKDNLFNGIKAFEERVVQTSWHIEDVKSLKAGISDENAKKILNIAAHQYELSDYDWLGLDFAIECFEEENSDKVEARIDNYLHVEGDFKKLEQFQAGFLSALSESPYPEWPEYAERKLCFKVDFGKVLPIPEELSESEQLTWMFANWGVYGNPRETLITDQSTIADYPVISTDADDYIELFFETSGVPLPVIRKLISDHMHLNMVYTYYDQSEKSAGHITSIDGEISEVHYTDNTNEQISKIGHSIFGYDC